MLSYNPETLIAVAAYVQREYGYSGYRIQPNRDTILGNGEFIVTHTDGSEFRVNADRDGNAYTVLEKD